MAGELGIYAMPINHKSKDVKHPNFFIVGAMKGGTTSIFSYLREHPQVFMCPIKEPHHFCKDFDPESFYHKYMTIAREKSEKVLNGTRKESQIAIVQDWDDYLRLFEKAEDQIAIGEASVGYLYSRVAASEIKEKIPDAKIIMILRDPVKRAFSHYLMGISHGYAVNMSFVEAVENDFHLKEKGWGVSRLYVECGLYYEQVMRYLDLFPMKNIKVILFEQLQQDAGALIKDIFKFLDVDPDFQVDLTKRYNTAKFPIKSMSLILSNARMRDFCSTMTPSFMKESVKKIVFTSKGVPELKDEDRARFLPYFREDIKKLSELLKVDLSEWMM